MRAAPRRRLILNWATIALVGGIVAILTWDSGSSSEHARQEEARREAHDSLYGLD